MQEKKDRARDHIRDRVQQYKKERRKRKQIQVVLTAMCVLVALMTVRLLVLPAITMEWSEDDTTVMMTAETAETTTDIEGYVAEAVVLSDTSGSTPDTQAPETQPPETQPPETQPPETEAPETKETQAPAETEGESQTQGSDEVTEVSETVVETVEETVPESETGTVLTATTAPIDLTDGQYVSAVRLYYQNAAGDWIYIRGDSNESIPADATMRLELDYKDIPIEDVIAAGGILTYELPKLLKNPVAQGSIISGDKVVGSVTAVTEDGTSLIVLTLDEKWLTEQQSEGHEVVDGNFYVEAQVDYTKIPVEGPATLVVGELELDIYFENDLVAKYGEIEIEKSEAVFTEDGAGSGYLTYTLTVSVPANGDAMPDVKIVDHYTTNGSYVDAYIGVSGTRQSTNELEDVTETISNGGTAGQVYIGGTVTEDTPIPEPAGANYETPGTLVWEIGTMQPGETRTLTYKVRLKEDYVGSANLKDLINTAETYSKTYKRDEASVKYTPKAAASVKKTAGEIIFDEDGETATLTYTVVAKANDQNSYTLTDVKLYDIFPSGALVNYGSFVEDSFHLYNGNGTTGTEIALSTVNPYADEGKLNPQITNSTVTGTSSNFTAYIGNLAPGEEKTLVYTVKINAAGAAVNALNNELKNDINNRITIRSDDTKDGGNVALGTANSTNTVTFKKWERKLAGRASTEAQTITIPSDQKVYSDFSQTVDSSRPDSFKVSAGSFQYNVIVNETGDWDMSSATLKDTIKGNYLQYSGYLQIRAYTITDADVFPTNAGDAAVLNQLNQMTPTETIWVKIDDLTSFSFKPKDVGLNGNQAYLLTYYAEPVNMGDIISISVSNSFDINGDVIGPGGTPYVIPGISVSVNVTVHGSGNYSASKTGWYHTIPSEETDENYSNGAIYWAIKLDGTIPEGFQVGDYAYYDNDDKIINIQRIYDDAVVGVYLGPSGGITGIGSVELLQANHDFTALTGNTLHGDAVPENADYTWNRLNQNGSLHENRLQVTFQNSFSLTEDQSIYIIVKTSLNDVASKPDYYVARNGLVTATKDETLAQTAPQIATMGIAKNGGVTKEAQGAYTYDGETLTALTNGASEDLMVGGSGGIDEAGVYLSWLVRVNIDGEMSGLAQIEDQLPDGVELTYVRTYGLGSDYSNETVLTADIAELENAAGWVKRSYSAPLAGNGSTRSHTYYYNKTTNQVRWAVDNLAYNPGDNLAYVEYQIVVRVTDTDAILGEPKDFMNQVTVTGSNGRVYEDSADISLTHKTLDKSGTDEGLVGARYYFEIELNPLGQDLIEGASTITLIDEMSSAMTFDTDSIKVINSKTGEAVTDYKLGVETTETGQKLSIVLPDDIPLTISYTVTVTAAPNETVAFSNTAHWEGYEPPDEGYVEVKEFKYSVGGTVSTSNKPSFKLTKVDEADVSKKLAGAVFSLQAGTMENGVFTTAGEAHEKTTGADGTLTFSVKEGDTWLEFNTVYCLREVTPPTGYVANEEPYYFIVAQGTRNEDGVIEYPDYPEGVFVYYTSAEYEYTAYNAKGQLEIVKAFADTAGNTAAPIDGTYHFGIYDNPGGSGDPIQTLTVTYTDGVPDKTDLRFKNLELDQDYYIFELDDSGKPISAGSTAAANGMLFEVSYTGGSEGGAGNMANLSDGEVSAVTITNRSVEAIALPESGGTGPYGYISGGILLMAAAGLMYHKKSGRKGGKSPV